MKIRRMAESDLPHVNDIVNWHTENGFATFVQRTSDEERLSWFQKFKNSSKEISLVAVQEDGLVLGFACSFLYRNGDVFQKTLETSIYLRHDQQGKGLGSALYGHLFELLSREDVHRIVVGIALPNDGSVALHRKFGFEDIGTFDEYAFYKGAYRSSLWMQKKMNSAGLAEASR